MFAPSWHGSHVQRLARSSLLGFWGLGLGGLTMVMVMVVHCRARAGALDCSRTPYILFGVKDVGFRVRGTY